MKSLNNVQKTTYTAILIALMIVMHFTFGYITAGAIEMCFMTVPVVIGAILLGPVSGAVLGGVFGLSSLLCAFGIGHPSAFGASIVSINPFYAVILCIVPRVLMGVLVGLIYKILEKSVKNKTFNVSVSGFAGAFLNTALFMFSLIALYGSSDMVKEWETAFDAAGNILKLIVLLVGLNGLIEAVICTAISILFSRVLITLFKRRSSGGSR